MSQSRTGRIQSCIRAFPNLPDEHVIKQIIYHICHGSIDREAGHYVVNLHLDTVEEELDEFKSFQYSHPAIFDRGHRKQVRELYATESDSDSEAHEPIQIRAAWPRERYKKQAGKNTNPYPWLNTRLDTLDGELGSMRSNMETILQQVGSLVAKRS